MSDPDSSRLPDTYFSEERDDFLSLSDISRGPEYRARYYSMHRHYAQSLKELLENRRVAESLRLDPRLPDPPEPAGEEEPIPRDVYYSVEHDSFYDADRFGMGVAFHARWFSRRDEFPQSHERLQELGEDGAGHGPIPPQVYYCPATTNFYDFGTNLSRDTAFHWRWFPRRDEFPARPDPVPPRVYYSREDDNFYQPGEGWLGQTFYRRWKSRSDEFPCEPPVPDPFAPAQILKGTGLRTGDGWKDTTREGETVYVWCSPLPAPHEPGQYPRVLHPGWSASVHQYSFQPATVEEVRELFASLAPAKEPGL